MNIQCTAKQYTRRKQFTVRISQKEEIFLKTQAQKLHKTITDLIREGYILKMQKKNIFEKIG